MLLLDEPFAAIDAKVRKELRHWLKDMIEQVGITSVFVTHDQEEAVEVADELIITNEGCVEQVGTPIDIYKNPQTSFVAQFIGESVIPASRRRSQCSNPAGIREGDCGWPGTRVSKYLYERCNTA